MAHYARPDAGGGAPYFNPNHNQAYAPPPAHMNDYAANTYSHPHHHGPYPQPPPQSPNGHPRSYQQQSPRMAYRNVPPYPNASSSSSSPISQHAHPLPKYPPPQPYAVPVPGPPPNGWVQHPQNITPQLLSPIPQNAYSGVGLGLQIQGVPQSQSHSGAQPTLFPPPAIVSSYPTPPPETTTEETTDEGPDPQEMEDGLASSSQYQGAEEEQQSTSPQTHAPVPIYPSIVLSRRHHRPNDPTRAPGVMISPRARPPQEVIDRVGVWDEEEEGLLSSGLEEEVSIDEIEKNEEVVPADPGIPIAVTVPPVILSASSPPLSTTDDWDIAPPASASASPSHITISIPSSSRVSTPTPTSSAPLVSPTTASTSAPAPAPPQIKKSWASLFNASSPNSSSSAGTASSTTVSDRARLPTSSVVGFSVPADQPLLGNFTAISSNSVGDGVSNSLPPPTRNALLALLSGTPNEPVQPTSPTVPTSPTISIKPTPVRLPPALTPRGLINTGNMCFANAVLQVLLCTRAFYGLFENLQSVLGEQAFLGDRNGEEFPAVNGNGIQKKEEKDQGPLGPAPLVRATATFLKEFVRNGKGGGARGGTRTMTNKGKARADEQQLEEDGEAFIPTMVYDALKGKKRFDGMRGGQQEDAEEFLGFFLDTLEEELLAVAASLRRDTADTSGITATSQKPAVQEKEEPDVADAEDGWLEVGRKNRSVVTRTIESTDSPITRIFGGKFRSTLKTPGQRDSVIVEDWRALRLDIQRDGIHTVEDALALISQPSTLQVTHVPSSTNNTASSQPNPTPQLLTASQQVLIEALPPVLVLHLKRFCYDAELTSVVKVGKQIAFGPELEVPEGVMSPGLKQRLASAGGVKPRRTARYKLFGVVYHHGMSASGGHYTLDVLHPGRAPASAGPVPVGSYSAVAGMNTPASEGAWVRIDDELVSDVRPADVFGAAAPVSGSGAWPTVGANGKTVKGGRVQSVEREGADDSGNARCAYLLFYRRVG
ncbi:Ubiquitin carboxyl-terminal hydrolase [Mycena indigotica]|uniref:Ubiquitin carboxyl-terminal hydrolase n=1 Tax=Mycena indigotica TaxID=2126181 RepID=A0A8H6S1L0_9AGAR|nr:Ubiquitin carboxyl-terminal hydrolase [Mycena indigotica]KAF7291244.1 Ubiquitin carboxyl-terminal hydrolase [Mycena indigotica]